MRFFLHPFLVLIFLFADLPSAQSQFITDSTKTTEYLVKKVLLGEGVEVTKIRYRGAKHATGMFTFSGDFFPLKKGILITTGRVDLSEGPNDVGNQSVNNHLNGDEYLDVICKYKTFDASVLEFDFTTNTDSVSFNYIFGSEEYPEYVGSAFNDVFAFAISGPGITGTKNLAVVPRTIDPITVNTVNLSKNQKYFLPNYMPISDETPIKYRQLNTYFQYDGFTKKLKAECKVQPGQTYHIKIAIGDVADHIFDSGVFLEAKSFSSKSINYPQTVQNPFKNDTLVMYIQFDFDKFEIPDSSANSLGRVKSYLNRNTQYDVLIVGHTDNQGTDEYNIDLSKKRADAIANHLIEIGVESKRITTDGQGFRRPAKPNTSEENRAKNRRVEFILKKKKDDG
ncbi:MAG: OmpA family protein [Bacteroidota bacterium]